jgi:hypothetical protein
MATLRINRGLVVDYTNDGWAEFKKWLDGTKASLKFAYVDLGVAYDIACPDGDIYRTFSINKSDATDFETNFKSRGDKATHFAEVGWNDPALIRRFGNLTAASASEVLLCARGYTEPASEAQRSVVSTSAQDASGGSGAKQVRITYLTSNYVLKTEDVVLNGTNAVNTVASDIRFIEKFQVIQGAAAAGAIKIMTTTAGGGSEFCGIGVGTYDAFLCHHYVPAGKTGYVYCWYGSVSDDVNFKLLGRALYGANLVDEHWGLINLTGITAGAFATFERRFYAVPFGEKTYIRINVVPGQGTSTVVRGELIVWEQ